jgi:cell division protein FtsN
LLQEPLAPDVGAPVAAAPGMVAPNVAAPNMTAQGLASQGLASQGLAAPSVAAPRVPSAVPVAPPARSFADEAPRRNAPVRDPDPKLVQEAETGAPGAADEAGLSTPLKGLAYSVQVGDYQEEKGARRLAEQLESKGYTPSIFSGRDAENRVWFAVRIGAYAGAKDASQAAANFTKQEKLKATVRPVNAF